MKTEVIVTLREGVLDPQGEAIRQALNGMGFDTVETVRQGKFIELELSDTDAQTAHDKVKDMSEKLLANTVIESYKIEILK